MPKLGDRDPLKMLRSLLGPKLKTFINSHKVNEIKQVKVTGPKRSAQAGVYDDG